MARLPFEHKYFMRAALDQDDVCWFVQRELWRTLEEKGLPDYLAIPEEKLLLLK